LSETDGQEPEKKQKVKSDENVLLLRMAKRKRPELLKFFGGTRARKEKEGRFKQRRN